MAERQRSLLGDVLNWGVETLARGIAKGAESILGDAEKALRAKRQGVESWREAELDAMATPRGGADDSGERKAAGG